MLETFASSPFARSILEDRYAQTKPDGSKETWSEVAERVVDAVLGPVLRPAHMYHDAECYCVDCLGSVDLNQVELCS